MSLQELLEYLQRKDTDVLGYLPNMHGNNVSPRPLPGSANADYDMTGWQLKNGGPRLGPVGGHFTDEFKLPNHPTFSNESKYSNELFTGGKWKKDGSKDVFHPSLVNYMINTPLQIDSYFKEIDPSAETYKKPISTVKDYADLIRYRTTLMPSDVDEDTLSTARTYLPQNSAEQNANTGRSERNDWSDSELLSIIRGFDNDGIDPLLSDLSTNQRNKAIQLSRYLSSYAGNGIDQKLSWRKYHSY